MHGGICIGRERVGRSRSIGEEERQIQVGRSGKVHGRRREVGDTDAEGVGCCGHSS